MARFPLETAEYRFIIILLFSLFVLLDSLSSQSTLFLINQSEREYISRLSEIILDINQSFRDNTNLDIVVPDSDNPFILPHDEDIYLKEAFERRYDFIIINDFSIRENDISIESAAYRGDTGDIVFNLSSSGSISLGLENKLNFIIRKINQKLVAIQREIEQEKSEPDETDLYLSVFGEPQAQKIPEIEVPLLINDSYDSQIVIIPPGNDSLKIHFDSLYDRLLPVVTDEIASSLSQMPEEGDFISVESLEKLGLKGNYSDTQLLFSLEVPIHLMKEQKIGFRRASDLSLEDLTEQAPFSFYLNVFHNQQWTWNSIGSSDEHQFPGSFNFETAVNFRDWILSADYYLKYPYTEELPSFNLTRDFRSISSRLTLGHYSVDSVAYQSFGYFQGISFKRMPEIGVSPPKENPLYDFVLDSPSLVHVYINENLVKRSDLDMGRYSLIDFPLSAGINEIKLKIEDSFGNTREVDFFVPLAIRGLQQGDFSYSISAGLSPYTLDLPLITGNFMFGFTDFFTGGVNFQSDINTEIAGLTLIFPTVAGTFDIEAAQSWSLEKGFGLSSLLSYYYIPAGNRSLPTIHLFGRYNSPSFHTIGSAATADPDFAEFKASLSYNLADFIQLIPRGSIRIGRGDRGNTGSVQLGLRKRFSRSISASFDAGLDFPVAGKPLFTASLIFSIHDREKDQSLNVRTDTARKGGDVNWFKSFPGSNDASLSAGISGLPFNRETSSTVYARGRGSFNRFNGSLSSSLSRSENMQYSHIAQSSLSAALVFADRHLAVSKPVSDSFAIIVPRYNLKNMDVGVNPDGYGYDSQSDFLGNPVLSNLRSYNTQRVTINVTEPDTDIDMELGDSSFFLHPRYKSGTVIYTGTEFNVYLTGRLIEAEGSPLPFETGILTDRDGETHMFFTDREGVFFIYGLQRGECVIELNNYPISLEVLIPEDTEKKVDLGDIAIPGENR